MSNGKSQGGALRKATLEAGEEQPTRARVLEAPGEVHEEPAQLGVERARGERAFHVGQRRRAEPAERGDPLTDFLGSAHGKRLQRDVVRGMFGLLRKRL